MHLQFTIKYAKALILSLSTFFLPIQPLLILVGLFILSDTVLGVWAAMKNGEKITSKKLGAIIPKMLLYQSAVVIGFLLDTYLLNEFVMLIVSVDLLVTKMIAMTLVYIEILSINENFEVITTKNLFQSFKKLITRAAKIKEDIKEASE